MLHDVLSLEDSVELDGITTPCFSPGAGLIFFVWPQCGSLIGLFLKYFTLLRGVSEVIQQALFICTVCLIAWRDCIFVLCFPARALLVLAGKKTSPNFIFLT